MLNIILFGPPGSGKGTQAIMLAERYNLFHISTGDLFRSEIKNETPLGIRAKGYMERGELVPDSVTIGMLKNAVDAHPEVEGFIFDGFPRTVAQAEALDDLLVQSDQEVSMLIALTVPEEEIVKRILLRGETSGRPDDNDPEIIRNRIRVYEEETSLVYDYYADMGVSLTINGLGTIDEISDRLYHAVDTYETAWLNEEE
jgi:adenylate kinase